MAHSKREKKRNFKKVQGKSLARLAGVLSVLIFISALGATHFVFANTPKTFNTTVEVDPNFSLKTRAIQFLEDNDAEKLIPIIKCESRFRQYETDGSILKNKEGSSAIGIAQILSSAHPDPKIVYRYNKRNGTDFTVDDFNLNTFEGNIGYALVLYKIRGVQDWECAKMVR